ncbi:MAG TPA: ABC transporter permease [Gemmata sp.]|nr:ABC transporter permease [Gemmata sp.]
MSSVPSDPIQQLTPSAFRAFYVLVVHSFQRLWRVRQMGWVSLGLLAIVVGWVSIVTASPAGWDFPDRRLSRGGLTPRQYAELELLPGRYDPIRYDPKGGPQISPYEVPAPFDPVKNSIQTLILSVPYAVINSQQFVKRLGFMQFTLWVVLVTYLGFILPLFTLSYASAAFGTDRESRSLVWLMTRPIPRSGIYLAKFLGALPWCVLFGLGGFVVLCLAGGEYGRTSLAMYWPAATIATIAFSALFHLIGAIFRRPVVVGLVYVFFFESLVSVLPGSLKLLSLTFYARSLMYNAAEEAMYPVNLLEFPQSVTSSTAWIVLSVATVFLTAIGMWLFARLEYRDDI